MIRRFGLGAAAFGAVAMAVAGTAGAAFPEKKITFIIPYGPGGGFDTYVRKIAPVMAKHLGGKVNVIPKNIPGAGGKKAINVLYRAKPNGYNIAVFNMPGMLLDKILGRKTSFDIDKFTWLGRIAQSKYVLVVGKKSPYQSIESLQKAKRLKYAITSTSSGAYIAGKIMGKALGMNIKFLPGYKGSAKVSLSMIRGDTHLSLFNTRSYAKWAKGGDLKAVLSFEKKSPFAGVPTVTDVGRPKLHALTIERVVGTTPGVSAKVQKILSNALFAALNDPVIKKWHKKTRRPIDPLRGPETAKVLENLANFFGQYKAILK
ncbi:MAG: tripartite tricarboxylate transporter substrate-binding protein [Alphaproteobacteria bacterium]|nr:tripartite tricarboxylate transporter substrate-binding protein [Alphaproteobacteria bacterium]